MKRTIVLVLAGTARALAHDWGMGPANSGISPPSIFRPVSTPAHEMNTLAIFTLAVTTAIFVVVSGLLTYSVVRFRSRRGDEGSEPPQVYGSGPVEFAWTAVPVLIVFVLILTTARSVYTVQAARRPPHAVAVRVVGHQWWWEFQHPELGIVTANELHVPVGDETVLTLKSADVAHSSWVPRLAPGVIAGPAPTDFNFDSEGGAAATVPASGNERGRRGVAPAAPPVDGR